MLRKIQTVESTRSGRVRNNIYGFAYRPGKDRRYFPKDVFRRMEDGTQVSYSNKSISRKNIERFLREARTMAGLRHDNIVSVTDVFEENNTAYYVMDYVEGRSLEDRGRLNENVALKYVRQVADA